MRFPLLIFSMLLGCAGAVQAQRNQSGGLTGGLSSTGSGTIFYIDPLLNERTLSGTVPDLTDLLADYRLRPGDIVSLSVRGGLNIVVRAAVINTSGEFSVPEIGPIAVRGLLVADAAKVVQEAVGRVVLNAKTTFSLERPAPIQIRLTGLERISGPARFDAPVRLSELSLAFGLVRSDPAQPKALPEADLRRIMVTDAEGRTHSYDLQPFLAGVRHRAVDPYITDGSVVHIGPRDDSRWDVAVSGAVARPVRVSWHPEDTIQDLIAFAGGFLPDADSTSIMVLGQRAGGSTGIGSLNTGAYRSLKVNRGDNVIVGFGARNQFGKVRVLGEVRRPGVFPIEEGRTTLADLLELAGGAGEQAIRKVIIVGKPAASPWPQPKTDESEEQAGSGKLEKAGRKPPVEQEPAQDLWDVPPGYRLPLRAAQNTADLQRGPVEYLEGLDYLQLEGRSGLNRRVIDLTDRQTASAMRLSDGDVLIIPFDDGLIQVFGQVNRSGLFGRKDGARASYYIEAAGGKTPEADGGRVFVIKAGTLEWRQGADTVVEPGDAVFVDRKPLKSFEQSRVYDLQKKQFMLSVVSTIFGAITTMVLILNVGR